MIGYFTLLKRSLHTAPRPEVLEYMRPIFKVFMEAFDVKMVFGFTEVSIFRNIGRGESCKLTRGFLPGRAPCDIGLY